MPSDAAQVDTIKNHAQSGRLNFQTSRVDVLQVGKLESPFLQNLVEHGEAVVIPEHAFEAVSSLILEHKQISGERIKMHCRADDAPQ